MSGTTAVPIGDIVSKVATCDPRTDLAGTWFEYIDISSINRESKRIEGSNKIAAEVAPSRARQMIRAKDILVSTVRPNLNAVAQVPDDLESAIASTGFTVLRPKEAVVHSRYLFHWVRSRQFVAHMIENATGASYPAVSDRVVKESLIPLPSLNEQRSIAAVLDKADALREKRRKTLNKLDTLLESVFLDMFGDPLAGKEDSSVAFGTLVSRITYGFTCPMKHLNEGIPIITAKNVFNGSIDFINVHYADRSEFDALTSKSKPKSGDILITKDGTIGRCAVVEVDFPFCINQSVALIEPKHQNVSADYLVGYLNTSSIQRRLKSMGKGNALQHLQITELAKLPIHFPSNDEQRQYVKTVKRLSGLTQQLQKFAELTNTLFNALQQRAFKGDLLKTTSASITDSRT